MQINATTPIQATLHYQRPGAEEHAAQRSTESKVFTPAPPLRPNVQDYVDIDRTLIALRQG